MEGISLYCIASIIYLKKLLKFSIEIPQIIYGKFVINDDEKRSYYLFLNIADLNLSLTYILLNLLKIKQLLTYVYLAIQN